MSLTFGADYYPEHWSPHDLDEDLRIMQDLGLTSVRLGEFAWALMEPKPGRYDFSFFERVLDKLQAANMTAILGTPTATFPPWLAKKHPEVLATRQGIVRQIGGRRQAALASKQYRLACERIVTKMAQALGKHPAVVAWQIDNELGHEGSDIDEGPAALAGFRAWLKIQYKNIKNLNEAWGGRFWGILYTNWDEIPTPGVHVQSDFPPSMLQDFYRYHSDLALSFVRSQAQILRKHSPGRAITTNLYPSPFLPIYDWAVIAEELDYISWDNYPVWGDMAAPYPHPLVSFMHEYARGLKNRAFTVMEQICGFQGHRMLGYLPPPGQVGMWLKHAVAHGANQVYFFRYRTAHYGQEQLCYGLLDHDKELTSRARELRAAMQELRDAGAAEFADEPPPAPCAVVYDIENVRNCKIQPISKALEYRPVPYANVGYDVELATWFGGLNVLNAGCHVRPASHVTLDDYKFIVLPLYWMADDDFVAKLDAWVRAGGTLLLGYRAGLKEYTNAWMRDDQVPGPFAEMAGVRVRQFEGLDESQSVKMRFRLLPGRATKMCEIVEPRSPDVEVVARYTDRRKFYRGAAAITRRRHGQGTVYYCGTSPGQLSLVLFYRRALRDAGITFRFLGAAVERVLRKDAAGGSYAVTLNHSGRRSWLAGLRGFGVRVGKD